MRSDQRSAEARAYRRLYDTARWKQRRAAQLQAHPLCRMCRKVGRITPATVADHVHPHRGDERLFFEGALQSLCAPHHDAGKQQQEARGYSTEVSDDGVPTDPNHPWNKQA